MYTLGKGTPYQHSKDEGRSVGVECLLTLDQGEDVRQSEWQCHNGGLHNEVRGHSISGHVQAGAGDYRLVRTACGLYHCQLHPEEKECSGR